MNRIELLFNVLLMLLGYGYAALILSIANWMRTHSKGAQRVTRKFVHLMMGNFPFLVPFFTVNIFPTLVAAPFVVVTFLVSPYSPSKSISSRLKTLSKITEEGHHLGLVFYTMSYTILAFFFADRPYVLAAGILSMAYGDSAASIIGEKYGKRKYNLVSPKSLEGSAAMFGASLCSIIISQIVFSTLFSFSFIETLMPILVTSIVVTLVESLSPRGIDNLTVPIIGALTFLLLIGGL
ncbi:MAG: diacylglycerol/polyprenol kinase family protein [Candidatus Hodarchaeota archaeon]